MLGGLIGVGGASGVRRSFDGLPKPSIPMVQKRSWRRKPAASQVQTPIQKRWKISSRKSIANRFVTRPEKTASAAMNSAPNTITSGIAIRRPRNAASTGTVQPVRGTSFQRTS